MTQTPAPTTRIRIVIDVEYPSELSAGGSSSLLNGLHAQLDSAVGSGLLDGPAGEHPPDTWSARVTDVTDEIHPPSEGTIGNWLSCQIEDGNMLLEDVPPAHGTLRAHGPSRFPGRNARAHGLDIQRVT